MKIYDQGYNIVTDKLKVSSFQITPGKYECPKTQRNKENKLFSLVKRGGKTDQAEEGKD